VPKAISSGEANSRAQKVMHLLTTEKRLPLHSKGERQLLYFLYTIIREEEQWVDMVERRLLNRLKEQYLRLRRRFYQQGNDEQFRKLLGFIVEFERLPTDGDKASKAEVSLARWARKMRRKPPRERLLSRPYSRFLDELNRGRAK